MISQVNAVYVVSIASVLERGREVKGGVSYSGVGHNYDEFAILVISGAPGYPSIDSGIMRKHYWRLSHPGAVVSLNSGLP